MRRVTLLPGHSKPLWHGHPWVFADSIAMTEVGEGDLVLVTDADGSPIGRGWLSPSSQIRVRVVVRGEAGPGPDEVVPARIEAAAALRRRLFPDPAATDAYRVVHGEGDGIPGLVVDRYGETLVAQFATKPVHARRARIAGLLLAATGARSLVARAAGKEEEEGIAQDDVPFAAGDPSPDTVLVHEEGLLLRVDLRRGQKTGHYADQRENRRVVAHLCGGARVLDLYAGTGGFALRALLAGAKSALAVDASEPAVATARENAAANGVSVRLETVVADAEERLQALAREKATFDVVVADPPRFAATRKGVPKALAAYRRLNARAMARVAPGGFLATFSCSGLVDAAGFEEAIRGAARECRREASIVRTLSAGPDHPADLAAPEGRYLTGLLLRVRA